jgi:hypothetical protein
MILPPTRSQGNILINNNNSSSNNSSNNIYPMDCEPSVISISSSNQPSVQIAPSSLNINQQQQRYLQHMHNRSSRYIAPTLSSSGYVGQKYAPASLPIDLISANNGNGSSIVVLPSTTQDHHLNSSASLIINHPTTNVYAPFNDGSSIHHQNLPKVGSANSRNLNSNTNNNNSASNDESMVGVCVQQSPVVIH